jgi:hypothetical protein
MFFKQTNKLSEYVKFQVWGALLIVLKRIYISCAIFLKTIGSETHRVTQNSVVEGEVLVTSMLGEKVVEHHSSLRPSQKELPEWRSSAPHHKNTPVYKLYLGVLVGS